MNMTTLPPPNTAPNPRDAWRDDPATDRQIDYLRALITQRQCDKLGPIPPRATKGLVSQAIEWCKRQPLRSVPAPDPQRPPINIADGLYAWRDVLVRVKRAIYTSGQQYAQTWNPQTESWDTRRGLLRDIKRDILTGQHTLDPLPAAAASAFGKLYGRCINCMKTLTDDHSIARGYGAVCAANNGWEY